VATHSPATLEVAGLRHSYGDISEINFSNQYSLQHMELRMVCGNVNGNAKTAIAKRPAVQIINLDRIHETQKFSADDEKQSETWKQ